MFVRTARQSGLTLPMIRAWLTEKLEREPQPDWPKAWRLVFDNDGHFSLITPDDEINVDGAVLMLPSGNRRPDIAEPPGEIAPPSESSETDLAINLAAQVLKEEPNITREALRKRVLAMRRWATELSVNRFRTKVWARARERAGLDSKGKPGAPRKT